MLARDRSLVRASHLGTVRRIVVEMPVEDFVRLKGGGAFYQAVESFSVLQVLRAGPGGASSIVQIRPKDPKMGFDDLARLAHRELQLLDTNGDTFTCLMKTGRATSPLRRLGLNLGRGYIVPPIEIGRERARLTYVGNSPEVGRFLHALRRLGLRHRSVSISDLRLSPGSPLTALTDKQVRVVRAAYQEGYYDRPRRVTSKALARRLGLSSSTLVNHRLKAERRILSAVLGQEPLPHTRRRRRESATRRGRDFPARSPP